MDIQTHPNAIETRTARLWLGEDGIIRKVFLPDAQETLADALESEEVIRKIGGGKKRPILVDFTALKGMDPEAREYYISERASSLLSACGGVAKSIVGRVISNFFMGLNKPPTPVKLFATEKQSVEWLEQFITDDA